MHQFLKFILFCCSTLHVSDGLFVHHQESRTVHIPDAVCTVLGSWWWTEKPPETHRVLFQNKINLRYCASIWSYYRNRTVGVELFHADKQTNRHMTKLIVAFHTFAKAPNQIKKNVSWLRCKHDRCVTDDTLQNPARHIQLWLIGLLLCCPRLPFVTAGL
jgi:hypothetical protein